MKNVASILALAAVGASAYAGNERPRVSSTAATTATATTSSSRRTFVTKAVGFVGASSLGWLSGGIDMGGGDFHASRCTCGDCSSAQQQLQGHGAACSCPSCGGGFVGLRPPAASAYERDVGGKDRSADTAALNLQARETNARLEKSGFKLDTKEEEEARLSSALSSFSYDSNSSAGKSSQKTAGKGYGKDSKTSK